MRMSAPERAILPEPMWAVSEERARLERMPDAVEATTDPVERADLSLPDPPNNPLRRKVAELAEALERRVSDESTPWHSGVEHVEESGPAESADG